MLTRLFCLSLLACTLFTRDAAVALRPTPVTSPIAPTVIAKVDPVRTPHGLSGDGIVVGVWDAGSVAEHLEFGNRVVRATSSAPGEHPTLVAGVLAAAGLDAQARGVAPQVQVKSFDYAGTDYVQMYAEARRGMRLSNHSYAQPNGWRREVKNGRLSWRYQASGWAFGQYSNMAKQWDIVMDAHPYYLAVKAVGNEAGEGPIRPSNGNPPRDCADGYACLPSVSTSKNALVVGALQDDGAALYEASSRGPTLDGRIKPDLVTEGVGVYTTALGGGYTTASGTSLAAPRVTGAVALLLEQEARRYGPTPTLFNATLKTILLHTARDLGQLGPDYQFGWGGMDVHAALDVLHADAAAGTHRIIQTTASRADTLTWTFDATGEPFRVTLGWTDPVDEHVFQRSLQDPTSPQLAHDLDLVVEQNGRVYQPFVLDPMQRDAPAQTGRNNRDNVEQVVTELAPGKVTVRVVVPSLLKPQRLALVLSGVAAAGVTSTAIDEAALPIQAAAPKVYPNPTQAGQVVTLEPSGATARPLTVAMYDAMGRRVAEVYRGAAAAQLAISVPSHLATGVYFLRLYQAGHTPQSVRLVIR